MEGSTMKWYRVIKVNGICQQGNDMVLWKSMVWVISEMTSCYQSQWKGQQWNDNVLSKSIVWDNSEMTSCYQSQWYGSTMKWYGVIKVNGMGQHWNDTMLSKSMVWVNS